MSLLLLIHIPQEGTVGGVDRSAVPRWKNETFDSPLAGSLTAEMINRALASAEADAVSETVSSSLETEPRQK
jgi:phosphoribosylanthranilate isomerase